MKSLNKLKYYQKVIENTINVGLHATGFKEKTYKTWRINIKWWTCFDTNKGLINQNIIEKLINQRSRISLVLVRTRVNHVEKKHEQKLW